MFSVNLLFGDVETLRSEYFPLYSWFIPSFSLLCIICSMLLRNFPRISPLISIHGRFIPPFPQLSIGDSSHRNGLNLGCASPDNDATSLFTTHHQPDRGHSVASSRKKNRFWPFKSIEHGKFESPSNMVNLNQEMESNHGKNCSIVPVMVGQYQNLEFGFIDSRI